MKNTEKKNETKKPICFVIMPISDAHSYEAGHFGRVYEHLLKPAISAAGFEPVRADDTIKTDYIVLGIIQKIVESEMVICDFSARNPNVMYELGIRHAFNKPVALLKDRRTEKIFDIQGLRYVEYDDSLRIDTVQKDSAKITETIRETVKSAETNVNSVVQLAGITAAEVPARKKLTGDTQLIMSAIGSLERRVDAMDNKSRKVFKHFYIEDGKVNFYDGTNGAIGDSIYNSNADFIGRLIDIDPTGEKIALKQDDGQLITFSSSSGKSKGLSFVPF